MQHQQKVEEQIEHGGGDELRRLAAALRARLYFHQHCGIRSYPYIAPPFSQNTVAAKGQGRFGNETSLPGPTPQVRTSPPQGQASVVRTLDQVHSAVRACNRCPLADSSPDRILGFGRRTASVMVVGDYALQAVLQEEPLPAPYEEGAVAPLPFASALCFGVAEDALLWKMLQSIQLRPGDVYVTNALKCLPLQAGRPDEATLRQCQQQCQQHLIDEIQALRPKIICAMGDIAASVLIGGREPVARLRGRIHNLKAGGEAMARYKVMVTYHPRFLLQVQDMKRAAWEDLLRMQELLNSRGKSKRQGRSSSG